MKFKKYYPALLIAIPLLTAATFSSANGGFFASIANAGYGGQTGNCPDISSMMISPSSQTISPGGQIDFNGRNFGTEQDINITLNGTAFGKAHADGGGNFSTGSLIFPMTPGTYTVTFVGVNCNTPITSTITVSGNNNGGTGDNGNGGNNGGNTNTSSPSVTPSQATVSGGSVIDFNGRNFTHEENVSIYNGSTLVGTAHSDGGGNFTTGSITLPTTPGTYTYSFVGSIDPTPVTSTITVQ